MSERERIRPYDLQVRIEDHAILHFGGQIRAAMQADAMAQVDSALGRFVDGWRDADVTDLDAMKLLVVEAIWLRDAVQALVALAPIPDEEDEEDEDGVGQ